MSSLPAIIAEKILIAANWKFKLIVQRFAYATPLAPIQCPGAGWIGQYDDGAKGGLQP